MADITMCVGNNCPKKDNCYRYTATPSDYQSMFTPEATYTGEDDCLEFWDNKERINGKR